MQIIMLSCLSLYSRHEVPKSKYKRKTTGILFNPECAFLPCSGIFLSPLVVGILVYRLDKTLTGPLYVKLCMTGLFFSFLFFFFNNH